MSERKVFRVFFFGLPAIAVLNIVLGCINLGWVGLVSFVVAGLAMLSWYFFYWRTRHSDMWRE